MRLRRVGSTFDKFLMSFFKPQVISSSNFSSLFNVMTHNSSVPFRLKHNILSTKVENIKVQTFRLATSRIKIQKFFMSFLEPVLFSNFASLFSVMRQNPFVPFHLKIYMLSTKRAQKVQIVRPSAAWKLQATSPFSFKFCITFQYHDK